MGQEPCVMMDET